MWLEISFSLPFSPAGRALAILMSSTLVLVKLPRSCPKRTLGNSPIWWQGKIPDSHFIDFFISVRSPSPTSKIPPRLKFVAFKTYPNCIGRCQHSSTQRPERQLHTWTAMFTTEHFRRPSMHETISHLCLEKTRHAQFLSYLDACRVNWNVNSL